MLGDSSRHFCPVNLKSKKIAWPCDNEFAATYREKVYFFSSEKSLLSFMQNPKSYVADKAPLQVEGGEGGGGGREGGGKGLINEVGEGEKD